MAVTMRTSQKSLFSAVVTSTISWALLPCATSFSILKKVTCAALEFIYCCIHFQAHLVSVNTQWIHSLEKEEKLCRKCIVLWNYMWVHKEQRLQYNITMRFCLPRMLMDIFFWTIQITSCSHVHYHSATLPKYSASRPFSDATYVQVSNVVNCC